MTATKTEMGLLDTIYSCRSMRRFSARPVPEETLVQLVEAATRSPSAGNAQNWRFVIIRDRQAMARLARPWRRGIALMSEIAAKAPARPGEDPDSRRRTMKAVNYLAENFEKTPAVIAVCVQRDAEGEATARQFSTLRASIRHLGIWGTIRMIGGAHRNAEQELWATAYPAAQNILLAARGLGLGATMTVPKVLAPPGTYEKIMGLPGDVLLAALIPVGYPLGRFGPVSRAPVDTFISWDRYNHG